MAEKRVQLLRSGAILNVLDDGVDTCARILHRKISGTKWNGIHHVFLFDNGDITSCTMSKASRRVLEAGDSCRVGAYSRSATAGIIEADIVQHMADVGMSL